MVKKRAPKKRVKKAARPVRKSTSKAKARKGGVDFRPIKKDLRAHIAKLEKQLGGPEARAVAADVAPWETLDKLNRLNTLMTEICQPTMVIGS